MYNAALSTIGGFFESELEDHVREIDDQLPGTHDAYPYSWPQMAARGRGGIVLMSSLSATMGSALDRELRGDEGI